MKALFVISIVASCLISFNSEAQLQKEIARFRFELDFMRQEALTRYNSDEKVVAFVTSDGSYLISANNRFINKWNLKTGEYKQIKLNKKFAAAEEIKYAPDGLHMAYAAVNHIYIINTKTGKTVHTTKWKYDQYVNLDYYFSPNGKWCAIDGHGELFIVNLQNYSWERKSSWSDVAYITNQFVYFSDYPERKIYYYTLANPEYSDKIKASTNAIFGFDVKAAGEHGTLWFSKRRGYVHSKRYTYKKPAGGKKETVSEDVGSIKKLSLKDISNLSDLIPVSQVYFYNYIDKNTGLIYESEHKITNTDYFVSPYNNKYYIKVHNLQNPSQDIYLFQHETGKWLIVKGNHFECSLSWLSHEKITPLIMDYYSPGLITQNIQPNNNLFSTANEPKLNVFKQFIVDNKDKTALKKWFMPNLNDSAYTQSMTDFLTQYCKPVRFQNQQWYGDSEKLLRIEDNKIYFAFIENKSEDTYNGIYGIEDSLLVKGKIKQGELIEGKMFYKASVEAGSEGPMSYAVYDGEYKNWRWHGNGVLTWPNGAKYVGEFADGYFHGHGKYLDANGDVLYEGAFEKGKKVEKKTASQKQKTKIKPSSSHFTKQKTDSFIDKRDGKEYKTVKIGNQLWMAENLAFKPGSGSYWAYDNDNNNVAIYGYLYIWQTAQNICPAGWHLPSDKEWTELIKYLGDHAGGKLKETGTIQAGTGLWHESNHGATNETGFTALPGGYYGSDRTFKAIGSFGGWWSATEYDGRPSHAWRRYMMYNRSDVIWESYYKDLGLSVRCVRD